MPKYRKKEPIRRNNQERADYYLQQISEDKDNEITPMDSERLKIMKKQVAFITK